MTIEELAARADKIIKLADFMEMTFAKHGIDEDRYYLRLAIMAGLADIRHEAQFPKNDSKAGD